MAITTYRSVDQNNDTIKYVCESVYDGGRHYPDRVPPWPLRKLCYARLARTGWTLANRKCVCMMILPNQRIRSDFQRESERGRNRTFNIRIKSPMLCQLSYAPAEIQITSPCR